MTAQHVRLGDIDVGRIGLGTNRLRNTDENIAFIRAAVDAGVQMIDTAHLYTSGDSEKTSVAPAAQSGAPPSRRTRR